MDFKFKTKEELQKDKEELFEEYREEWMEIEDNMHNMYLQLESLIDVFDIDMSNTEDEVDKKIVEMYNDIGRMLYG